MDFVVDGVGVVNGNFDVGAKRAENWVNKNFAEALGSPSRAKTNSSSSESIYELDSDKNDEDSLTENLNDECESDHPEINGELSVNNDTQSLNQNEVEDLSDTAEMDEVFVIVDDEDEVQEEKNESPRKKSEAKERLLDYDGMNGITNESSVAKDKTSVPKLSDDEDEIESALADFSATESNEEKKPDSNVLLSSDDDGMDGLLEEFREEESLSANSPLVKNNSESISPQTSNADKSMGNDFKTTNFSVLKSLPTDKDASIVESIKSPAENAVSNEVNSAVKSGSDCVIMCDEKSNASDSSSIEILDDDSQNKSSVQNTSSVLVRPTTFKQLNSPLNSPSFSSSSEDKFEFQSIISDIVGETTSEKDEKKNVSQLESKSNSLSENASSEVSRSFASIGLTDRKSIVNNSTCSPENNTENSNHLSENLKSIVNDISVLGTTDSENQQSSNEKQTGEILETPDNNQEISSSCSSVVKMDTSCGSDDAATDRIDKHIEKSNTVESIASSIQEESSTEDRSKDKEVSSDSCAKEQTVEKEQKDTELVLESHKSVTDGASTNESNIDYIPKNETCSSIENRDETKEIKMESKNTLESEETKSGIKSEVSEIKEESESQNSPKTLDCDIKADEHFATKVEENNVTDDSVSNSVVCKIPKDELQSSGNKRKLEDEDLEAVDSKIKKMKNDGEGNSPLLNGERNFSDSSSDFDVKNINIKDKSKEEAKTIDRINSFMSYKDSDMKIRASLKTLERVAVSLTSDVIKENYTEDYIQAENMIHMLEEQLKSLKYKVDSTRLQIAEIREKQRVAFAEHNFKPKESEMRNSMSMQNVAKPNTESSNSVKQENPVLVPKTESPVASAVKPVQVSPPVVTTMQMKDTIITPVLSNQQVNIRKQLMPRIITQPQQGRPPLASQVISVPGGRMPAPNVTVSGNTFISVGRPPTTHGVVLLPSSTVTSSRNQYIDLTKEEQRLQKTTAAGISTPTTSIAKVNMPRMPGNPNVLLPLKDYLQLLPPGSKGSAIIQNANMPRPTIIPPLPSSLVGARTVTYIVPPNSGLGARGLQPFLQGSNQQVQFLLRVTNPGTASSISSVTNTMSKPTMLQPPLATATRLHIPATAPRPQMSMAAPRSQMSVTAPRPQIPGTTALRPPAVMTTIPRGQQPQVTSTPQSSNLVMITRDMSKHPAPFPKSPQYPDKKGKALPPKPSLKGSKNSNGIVLSWNMCLYGHHANIASYQLFAYQETDGPVDSSLWKKVGDVNALPLPMACTLTQFVDRNRYYFTVRAVDAFQRFGPFSDPVSILYERENESVKK